ncbi:FAD/NAD(P)-binding domain-containing protein [Pseudonocardia sp. WMMC193]|uniref:FAD/NAD(P)-binding protein n=1 Tax=Pseudonocardia sp. WMMC193 TaxID=2911965 RepID=UPI001F3D90EC|nr:FAD/NAD(P)-binding protein [Pseudonocardia sp. WMMC193]MCF7547782.1 FAD/NAD(P)-binding protein [Pseudonocardia sp. WMMC193]
MATIAIIGAGPRGVGILERISASAPELLTGTLEVHLVDPHPAGAGRIWRDAQSPLLAMNSMAADVTMWTDDSVVCDGPIVPGPSFWDWAQAGPDVTGWPADMVAELRAVTPATFPSRRLQSRYLTGVLRDVVAGLPPQVTVHVHPVAATGLTDRGDRQVVTLDGEPPLTVDAVVLASGHLDATPAPAERALLAQARERGLRYIPPEQTTDTDLSIVEPGETVLARGLGLAFVDLVVLLFEGRGGRFENGRYVPSGREPVLVAGSPRGAPYHAKPEYGLRAGRPPTPHFLTPAVTDALPRPLDVARDLFPLMAKEIAFGWYHELVNGHPELVTVSWAEFLARFTELTWGSTEMAEFLAAAVPDPVDRIDFAALNSPFAGLEAESLAALQPKVRARIAEDLRQHRDERHTPHLGAFTAMLSVYGELMRVQPEVAPESVTRDVPRWQSFFNSVASGPPGFRVEQILALSEAGYLRFLGPGMEVTIDDAGFRATSAAVPDEVRSTVLIDARLADPSLDRTADPLLAGLLAAGGAREQVLVAADGTELRRTGLLEVRPRDGAVLDAAGVPHERRFAVGPHTTVKAAGAFTRPGMNAQSLRYNDAVARAVLRAVAQTATAAA